MTDRYASLKQGLVGCWIPSISGSGLLLPDLSGRGNNGSLVNMDASDWVASGNGRALDFDGVDDNAQATVKFYGIGSLCFWVKADTEGRVCLAFGMTASTPERMGIGIGQPITSALTNELITIYQVSSNGVTSRVDGYTTATRTELFDSNWHHISVVQKTENGVFQIYLDGISKTVTVGDSSLTSFGIGRPDSDVLVIGAQRLNAAQATFFHGQLDDVRLYSRALTESEIRLLASEPGIGFKRNSSAFATRYAYKPAKPRNYGVIRNRDPNYSTLRQGLVGAWCPSLANGGSGNTLPDVSGYNNHGVLTNMGPEDWVSGQYGRALEFDGVNDRIVASGNTSFTNGVVSVSGWMQRTGTAGVSNAVLFSKGTLEGNANSTCALYWNESLGWSWFILDAANNLTIVRSNTVTSQNQWVHVAGVASPAGVSLYLNGSLANSTTGASVKNSSHSSFIGGADTGGGTFATLLGQADDVRVYSRALTEPEIRLLASRPGIGLRQESHRNTFYQFPSGARRKRILTGMP